jgi:hypothetical protein
MNQQKLEDKSIDDLFKKMASLAELPDEEFRARTDKPLSKENIKETFEKVFP